jgi:hypothetical protein
MAIIDERGKIISEYEYRLATTSARAPELFRSLHISAVNIPAARGTVAVPCAPLARILIRGASTILGSPHWGILDGLGTRNPPRATVIG